MERKAAQELTKRLKKQGKTYTEIGEILTNRGYKGSTKIGTIQKWVVRAPSAYRKKRPYTRKQKAEVIIPKTSTGKILIMMCDMDQARELLG